MSNFFVPYEWYELQVDYFRSGGFQEFSKEKLFWMHMSPEPRFSFSAKDEFSNQKAFIITGDSIRYQLALLNIDWAMGCGTGVQSTTLAWGCFSGTGS